MSLNCDSQDLRVPVHHRSDPHESDCAPRTSRLSSLPLLLSKASLRRGMPRSPKETIRGDTARFGSDRSMGREGARKVVTHDGNNMSYSNSRKTVGDRDTKRMRGMGPPVAAISPPLYSGAGSKRFAARRNGASKQDIAEPLPGSKEGSYPGSRTLKMLGGWERG